MVGLTDSRTSDRESLHVLVSGASGYAGGVAAQAWLNAGSRVSLVTRSVPGAAWLRDIEAVIDLNGGSEAVAQQVQALGPDVIVHVAGAGGSSTALADIPPTVEANITLGTVLLEAAARCEVTPAFVGVGSFWEYAEGPTGLGPNSVYAATKSMFRLMARFYSERHGLRTLFVVPTDIYGPNDRRKRLLKLLAESYVTQDQLGLSGGEQDVSFLHVDDFGRGLLRAATRASEADPCSHEVWSLSGEAPAPLRQVVEQLQQKLEMNLPLVWGERPYRPDEVFSFTLPPRLPNWTSTVDLASGFRELVAEI